MGIPTLACLGTVTTKIFFQLYCEQQPFGSCGQARGQPDMDRKRDRACPRAGAVPGSAKDGCVGSRVTELKPEGRAGTPTRAGPQESTHKWPPSKQVRPKPLKKGIASTPLYHKKPNQNKNSIVPPVPQAHSQLKPQQTLEAKISILRAALTLPRWVWRAQIELG